MSSKSVVSEITNSQNGFFGGRAEGQITGVKVLTVADMEKMWVCSGTSADYSVYLPKPSECAGKMIGFRMDPGLTKLVTLDAGQTDNVKTGTVTVRADVEITTGHLNQATDNYDGYSFTSVSDGISESNFHVGDRLVYTWNLTLDKTSYVTALSPVTIANKLANGSYNFAYVRSLRSSGVVGLNTTFLTDLTVGGLMWINGESRTVGWIGDDTHCGVDATFSNAGSGLTYSADGTPYGIDGPQQRIMWANEVAILYSDGYKWTKIAGKSIPMSCSIRMGANQTFSANTATTLAMDTLDYLSGPSSMVSLANHTITVLRTGKYSLSARARFSNNTTATYRYIWISGVDCPRDCIQTPANWQGLLKAEGTLPISAGVVLSAIGFYANGTPNPSITGDTTLGARETVLTAVEVPTW